MRQVSKQLTAIMAKLLEIGARNRVLRYALILIVYLQMNYPRSLANPVCNTPDCARIAEYYKKNLNEHGNPCTDFYDYVCHGWGSQNPRPKHRFIWNTDLLLAERAIKNVKDLLENDQLNNGVAFEHAKALYRACMNLPYMEKTDAARVKSVMAVIDNMSKFATKESTSQNIPWWKIESYYISKTGESSILDFHLIANTYRNSEVTLYIVPPTSPYGMLKLSAPFHAVLKTNYKAFLRSVINDITSVDNRNFFNVTPKDLDDVMDFREKVAQISKNRFVINETALMNVKDIQEWYNNHDLGVHTAKIDWLAVTRSMYKNSTDPTRVIVQNTTLVMVELPYISKLAEILGQTPKRVIENHVHLYFAERHLKLTAQMESYLESSLISGANPTGVIRYKPEKWASCVGNHNLGIVLGHMYINSYFPMRSKQEVQGLLKNETLLLKERFLQSSWLQPNTRNRMIKKLESIKAQIGFPDQYSLVEIMKPYRIFNGVPPFMAHFAYPNYIIISRHVQNEINPITPAAVYLPGINTIGVSAAYLQWPIFIPNMPFPLKYGSAGFVLAHEMHHGFDYTGLLYDETEQQTDWWPQDMIDQFDDNADCFDEQYKKYRREEFQKHHITRTVNSTTKRKQLHMRPMVDTINEDMSDVMGLKIAYMGYKQELHKSNGTCPILPGLHQFGCEKLFFIAFGNVFCANSSPSGEEKLLLGDSHSFPRIRVNGAVGNMEEFHHIFKCKPGDKIVPKQMCDIWK